MSSWKHQTQSAGPAVQRAEVEAQLVGAMEAGAAARPRPTKEQWQAGPYAELLSSAEAYALSDPDSSSLIPASPPVGRLLRSMRLPAAPDGAAQLLKALGWWGPHQHVSLMRAQAELQMPPLLQVRPPPPGRGIRP